MDSPADTRVHRSERRSGSVNGKSGQDLLQFSEAEVTTPRIRATTPISPRLDGAQTNLIKPSADSSDIVNNFCDAPTGAKILATGLRSSLDQGKRFAVLPPSEPCSKSRPSSKKYSMGSLSTVQRKLLAGILSEDSSPVQLMQILTGDCPAEHLPRTPIQSGKENAIARHLPQMATPSLKTELPSSIAPRRPSQPMHFSLPALVGRKRPA